MRGKAREAGPTALTRTVPAQHCVISYISGNAANSYLAHGHSMAIGLKLNLACCVWALALLLGLLGLVQCLAW